jgi:hypothetical protein
MVAQLVLAGLGLCHQTGPAEGLARASANRGPLCAGVDQVAGSRPLITAHPR